jgi:hypothetical protein
MNRLSLLFFFRYFTGRAFGMGAGQCGPCGTARRLRG